ncbi:nuclear transport factor 2 family protein [Bradyrhizobium sp. Pear77]|uniref:nuclear transport factor 2 family protein n=1 Tax=Bradyrhizobium altum TaxID=1571202 RepID=UPI001E422D93|nr:nuclear transport factor 2 family protein [Bradyrhizobium altum]MCC8953529.1 nuclear transport factor 2 family protein [Bradyrhizobium altum]
MTPVSSPKEVVNALYDAYGRHDDRAILALYCDDATHDEVAQLKTKQGSAEIAVGMQKLFSWLPDVRWEVKSMIVGGDGAVAVAYVMRATAPQGSGATEAKTISLRGVQLLEVADGRIRHSEDYWDTATFQRQVS